MSIKKAPRNGGPVLPMMNDMSELISMHSSYAFYTLFDL